MKPLKLMTRRSVTATSLLATPLLFLRSGSASAQVSEMPASATSEAEQIALDAYIYGYSLITTDITRVQMSNVDKMKACMHRQGSSRYSPLPSGQLPRRVGAERRYALLACLA